MTSDIRLIQGDDILLTVTANDRSGTTIDLTDCEIIFSLIKPVTGIVLTKTMGDGVVITDDENGIFTVALSNADTSDLEGKYFFECQVTSQTGKITTLRKEDMNIPYLYFLSDVIQ